MTTDEEEGHRLGDPGSCIRHPSTRDMGLSLLWDIAPLLSCTEGVMH